MGVVREVKICWPLPDWVCLAGGCVHCDDGKWVTVDLLKGYASRTERLWRGFVEGRTSQWPNRETR